jgi:hypothetical protein
LSFNLNHLSLSLPASAAFRRHVTANKVSARHTGGKNARLFAGFSERRRKALRGLPRKVWPDTALRLAIRPLFKEVP